MKSDSKIKRDVEDELKWDSRVNETEIGVTVDRGVVALTGTVRSWMERLAAQEGAHRVAGVLDVANDIHVKPFDDIGRTDTDIARAVRHALEWDVLIPHERIRSTVTDGVVTLEGDVDQLTEFDGVARAVRNLIGVREVVNHIKVTSKAVPISPIAVRQAIEGALERHAQHAAHHVKIDVHDGTVTLTGKVPSWAELNAVEGAVRGTRGVRKVDSRVRIES